MNRILVFDTETTGLIPKKGPGLDNYYPYNNLQKYEECRLVSICWKVYTNDGTLLISKYYIIKPRDFMIDNTSISTKIHGITHEISQDGVDIKEMFANLELDIKDVTLLVAHNVIFDINILSSELYRYNQTTLLDRIQATDTYCTCRKGELITKIKPFGWKTYKIPKLIELYEHLFNEKFIGEHNADADTAACARCFFEMIKDNR